MSFKELVNASTMFLLRGLGLHVDILNKYGFISAYVDDVNHDIKYERSVFLLFRPAEIAELNAFIAKEYKRTEFVKEDYDYEGGFVVVAYSFPEKFAEDYNKFLMGEYSKFSDEYKKLFPINVTIIDEKGKKKQTYDLTYHIFQKSLGLRERQSIIVYGSHEDENGNEVPNEMLDPDTELWGSPYLTSKDLLDIERIKSELNIKKQ